MGLDHPVRHRLRRQLGPFARRLVVVGDEGAGRFSGQQLLELPLRCQLMHLASMGFGDAVLVAGAVRDAPLGGLEAVVGAVPGRAGPSINRWTKVCTRVGFTISTLPASVSWNRRNGIVLPVMLFALSFSICPARSVRFRSGSM